MPLYDYRCKACNHTFELRRSVEQRDEAECPKCRSMQTQRALSTVTVMGTTGGSPAGSSCAPRSSGFG